jgi:phosphatidylglycerophosphate synthase
LSTPRDASPPAARILRHTGADVRIFGLTCAERLRRAFLRAGCRDVAVVDAGDAEAHGATSAVVCRSDVILDERLAVGLVARRDALLVVPELGAIAAHVAAADLATAQAIVCGREPPAALPSLTASGPEALAPAWLANLRKREPAWVCAALPELAGEIEERAFAASYKGVTDLVTRWLWPRPALAATRWCARRGISPNQVTVASWLLAILAAWLFVRGFFAIGLVVAWAMTFLDTVDGKLARVTLTSSRVGDVLDHGLDLLHPPFWYLAWGIGVGATHGLALATGVVVAGYVVGRLLEGAFLAAFRIETHSWRPLDAAFRTVTARRNPNLILLSVGTLCLRPDLGLVMVALWTVASLAFHSVRLAQAFAARRRGEPVVAWDAAGAGG